MTAHPINTACLEGGLPSERLNASALDVSAGVTSVTDTEGEYSQRSPVSSERLAVRTGASRGIRISASIRSCTVIALVTGRPFASEGAIEAHPTRRSIAPTDLPPFALTPPQDPSANAPTARFVPHVIVVGAPASGSCSKDSSGSLTTLVRSPSEDVATEKKPTPIRKGHWRNKWSTEAGWYNLKPGTICLTDLIVIGPMSFTCPQIAESCALKELARKRRNGQWPTVKYLGPVFFPETPSP